MASDAHGNAASDHSIDAASRQLGTWPRKDDLLKVGKRGGSGRATSALFAGGKKAKALTGTQQSQKKTENDFEAIQRSTL